MKKNYVGGHKYAQAVSVTFDDGARALISYTTLVIEITPDGWLTVNGLYSMTTIKHIGWYMRELGLTYQLAKMICQNKERYNIHTGEIEKIGV